MAAGQKLKALRKADLLEDYYDNLHRAHVAMSDAFKQRDLSQDDVAALLDVDKSLISKRLKGTENLTLKILSFMATSLACRLLVIFQPHEEIPPSNYYYVGEKDKQPKAINQQPAFTNMATI